MHLSGRMAPGSRVGRDRLQATYSSHLLPREMKRQNVIFLVIIVAVSFVVASLIVCCLVRKAKRRPSEGKKAKSEPRGAWGRFVDSLPFGGSRYEQTPGDDSTDPQGSHQLNTTSGRRNGTGTQATTQASRTGAANSAAVDRNTSIRSIMTLPAYRQMASNNEQVLGREGERDGVDVIVDFPTEEHAEELREEEMSTLYQIREARRAQLADREERRREREEARQRRDTQALANLRTRTRDASNDNTLEELRQNVNQVRENRQRSVSTVSYAELGVARHDGTRIRANSNESERMGLLSDAASIGASTRPGGQSPSLHRRDPSVSSFVSVDSQFPSPSLTRSRGGSQPGTPRHSSSGPVAGSTPELVEADLGDDDMAPPPDYEDVSLDNDSDYRRSTSSAPDAPPPDYSGPYRSGSERSQHGQTESRESMTQERTGRGVGGVPQLPSLRIASLPEIVIEPSHDDSDEPSHRGA